MAKKKDEPGLLEGTFGCLMWAPLMLIGLVGGGLAIYAVVSVLWDSIFG